jgi:hypothetical protein
MASNPIFALLWLILLLVLAWPAAILCAILWVIFMVRLEMNDNKVGMFPFIALKIIDLLLLYPQKPFEACCACTRSINQTLEDFTKWPIECGNAIMRCSSACPSPTS